MVGTTAERRGEWTKVASAADPEATQGGRKTEGGGIISKKIKGEKSGRKVRK